MVCSLLSFVHEFNASLILLYLDKLIAIYYNAFNVKFDRG